MFIFCSVVASAQFGPQDNVAMALQYLQNQQLDSAKSKIDKASTEEALKNQPKTWYYRGFIYKELYKTYDKQNKTSAYRITAINSIEKLLELDKEKEFTESALKILKYLASTLYNDAARSLTPELYKSAEKNFELFKELMLIVDPNINLTKRDVTFKLALASIFSKSTNEFNMDSVNHKKALELYTQVLTLDSLNGSANYNKGILYYNKAVFMINNMDYDMDIDKLNQIQDHCVELFLQALPYMKKAYKLNWKKEETLVGLSSIYYGLNDIEKSEKYKQELEELKNSK